MTENEYIVKKEFMMVDKTDKHPFITNKQKIGSTITEKYNDDLLGIFHPNELVELGYLEKNEKPKNITKEKLSKIIFKWIDNQFDETNLEKSIDDLWEKL